MINNLFTMMEDIKKENPELRTFLDHVAKFDVELINMVVVLLQFELLKRYENVMVSRDKE